MALESRDRIAALLRRSADETEAREHLDRQLREAVDRVVMLAEPFDAFDVVECLKVAESVNNGFVVPL